MHEWKDVSWNALSRDCIASQRSIPTNLFARESVASFDARDFHSLLDRMGLVEIIDRVSVMMVNKCEKRGDE